MGETRRVALWIESTAKLQGSPLQSTISFSFLIFLMSPYQKSGIGCLSCYLRRQRGVLRTCLFTVFHLFQALTLAPNEYNILQKIASLCPSGTLAFIVSEAPAYSFQGLRSFEPKSKSHLATWQTCSCLRLVQLLSSPGHGMDP